MSDLISNRTGKKRSSMVRQPERTKSETTVSGNPICLTSVNLKVKLKEKLFSWTILLTRRNKSLIKSILWFCVYFQWFKFEFTDFVLSFLVPRWFCNFLGQHYSPPWDWVSGFSSDILLEIAWYHFQGLAEEASRYSYIVPMAQHCTI